MLLCCVVLCAAVDDGTKLLCAVEGLTGRAGQPCVIYSMGSAGELEGGAGGKVMVWWCVLCLWMSMGVCVAV